MKALVYHGPNNKSLEERPIPTIQDPNDAIIKIQKTTICGTDLHILKGDVPTVKAGRILGHEGVGIVDKIGSGVRNLKVGDHVLISCISACGICSSCRKGMFSHCKTGGWILGNEIDGTQAEYVRIPYADVSLYLIPPDMDEVALVMLSDVFPTAYECGILNGKIEPGKTVAIIGAGPIGLGALLTAQFYSPSKIIMIDTDQNRLEVAKSFGADYTIHNTDNKIAVQEVLSYTNKIGADTVIEAVGIPETFNLCQEIVAPGGIIANIGVHGKKVDLHLEKLWSSNITITTRLVDTITTPLLLKIVESKKLNPKLLITHYFKLDNIIEAYKIFGEPFQSKALKVIIET